MAGIIDIQLIPGITVTPLLIIRGENGDVMHGLKKTDAGFAGFGEAYFSSVRKGAVKGWKRHQRMTMNLVVPSGGIAFYIFDDRDSSPTKGNIGTIVLSSSESYSRLTVMPGVWMAFQGINDGLNLLMNVASISHDPSEAETIPPGESGLPRVPLIANT